MQNIQHNVIPDCQNIIDITEGNGNVTLILKPKVKLSDVFYHLPAGIVNKTETGIGATYLELQSRRNSIIVEPIKITASTKAFEHNAFYVGSPTVNHPGKVNKKDIISYLDDSSIKYKKIVVVADSLYKVYDIIKDKPHDFFLMIDEADSFQMDASFRKSMGDCLDIYKRFPKGSRALITATMLEFSDPILQSDPRTIIKYKRPTGRNIVLYDTNNVDGTAFEHLSKLLTNHPSIKVMVAYNSVSGCYNLAKQIVDQNLLPENDVKILCSVNSESGAKEFFSELNSYLLPGKVNFITSAYFSGFDLKEDYHLISISSIKSKVFALSEHKLKQIAGRCRMNLLSETVIYNTNTIPSGNPMSVVSKEDLIRSAEMEISALACIDYNYADHHILKTSLKRIRELIIENTKADIFQLVRQDRDGKMVIDYLNIDAYMETFRVMKEVYSTKNDLPTLLKNAGHSVTQSHYQTNTQIIDHQIEKVNRAQQKLAIINDLRKAETREEIDVLIKQPGITKAQSDIIKTFLDNSPYVEKQQLLDKLLDASKGSDSRKFNNTRLELLYATLSGNNVYKRNVNRHLVIGESYTPNELLVKWNKIMAETGLQKRLIKKVTATRTTNLHFTVKRNTKKGIHTLISEKHSVNVIKTRPDELSYIGLFELYI